MSNKIVTGAENFFGKYKLYIGAVALVAVAVYYYYVMQQNAAANNAALAANSSPATSGLIGDTSQAAGDTSTGIDTSSLGALFTSLQNQITAIGTQVSTLATNATQQVASSLGITFSVTGQDTTGEEYVGTSGGSSGGSSGIGLSIPGLLGGITLGGSTSKSGSSALSTSDAATNQDEYTTALNFNETGLSSADLANALNIFAGDIATAQQSANTATAGSNAAWFVPEGNVPGAELVQDPTWGNLTYVAPGGSGNPNSLAQETAAQTALHPSAG